MCHMTINDVIRRHILSRDKNRQIPSYDENYNKKKIRHFDSRINFRPFLSD